MNFYIGCGTLQGRNWSGAPWYVYHVIRAMAEIAPEHTFHLHLGRFASPAGPADEDPRLTELCSFKNVVRHDHPGKLRYRLAVPFGVSRSRSSVYYPMEGGDAARVWVPPLCPTAGLLMDCGPYLFPKYYGFMREFEGKKAALGRRLRSYNVVFTISNAVKREIVQLFDIDPEKIIVAPCAVDPSVTSLPQERPAQLPENVPYFLMVNPGRGNKNWEDVLAAFAIHLRAHPEADKTRLVLAGSLNDQREPIQMTLNADPILRNNVICTGYLSDAQLRYLYRHARLALYPSRYEGFGIPALEAMTFGIPLIVSDIAVLREVTREAALETSVGDPVRLAHLMHKLDADEHLRHAVVQRYKTATAQFRWSETASVTINALWRIA